MEEKVKIDRILKSLKTRRRNLNKCIKEEDKAIERLKYKSRSVRLSSPHNSRYGWYIDRVRELELVISFVSGKVDEKNFVKHLCGDSIDKLLKGFF